MTDLGALEKLSSPITLIQRHCPCAERRRKLLHLVTNRQTWREP